MVMQTVLLMWCAPRRLHLFQIIFVLGFIQEILSKSFYVILPNIGSHFYQVSRAVAWCSVFVAYQPEEEESLLLKYFIQLAYAFQSLCVS